MQYVLVEWCDFPAQNFVLLALNNRAVTEPGVFWVINYNNSYTAFYDLHSEIRIEESIIYGQMALFQ